MTPTLRTMDTAQPVLGRHLLLVEDDGMTSGLLARVLENEGFAVMTARDALEARALIESFDPDIALIDISLGAGPNGVDLAHVMHDQYPHIALLLVTRFPDLRSAGLRGYELPSSCGFLRKDRISDPGYLVKAIEQVLRDHSRDVRDDIDPERPLSELTEQQMEILHLMALGYTNDVIARMKGAGRSSVERWVAGILEVMQIEPRGALNPRVEAVRQYISVVGVPQRL
jgi:DNA-binding NarL/FixJ family response regulator